MDAQPQPSPMLQAIDLLRVNVAALQLDDLHAHSTTVLATIAALNEYMNSTAPKSANALRNARMLSHKLSLHMARLRDMLQGKQSAMAFIQSHASPDLLPPTPARRMGLGSRSVIRAPTGADNAASGPLEILGDEPQAQVPETRRGGEAKEGEPTDRLAKPGGERSEGGGRRW
ncbi:MAG: hypothetical protein V4542_18425 [Pseudomonadota bacterium]